MAPKLVAPPKGNPARPPMLKLVSYKLLSSSSKGRLTSSQQREVATKVFPSSYPLALRVLVINVAKSALLRELGKISWTLSKDFRSVSSLTTSARDVVADSGPLTPLLSKKSIRSCFMVSFFKTRSCLILPIMLPEYCSFTMSLSSGTERDSRLVAKRAAGLTRPFWVTTKP